MTQAESQDPRLPVTLITGFLGAGKTTLLNYILKTQNKMKFAVIENEFGAVNIDTDLLKETNSEAVHTAEEVISLDNGCLCCTVRGDLSKGVREILKKNDERTGDMKLDGLIIEASGVADPGPIIQTFYVEQDLQHKCVIDGVITLVDSKHVYETLGQNEKNEETGETKVNETFQQIAFADRILLNKTDLVDRDQISQLKLDVRAVNKVADFIECVKGEVDVTKLIGINRFSLDRVLEFDDQFLLEEEEECTDEACSDPKCADHACTDDKCTNESHSHGHSHGEKSCSKENCEDKSHSHGHSHEKSCSKENCEDKSHSHGHSHEASSHSHGHSHESSSHSHGHSHGAASAAPAKKKKVVRHQSNMSSLSIVLGEDEALDLRLMREFIGSMLQTMGEQLFRYKGIINVKGFDQKFVFQGVHMLFDGDFLAPWNEGEARTSKFVFIGKDLDKLELEKNFRECIVKPLRFKVGDKVMAKVKGGFKEGEVIKTWDNGNPYRIKLDHNKVDVYGPLDDDRVVQAVPAAEE